eukprot:GHVU01068065.1.p3 GENE.GHVU01068065.1~~GHVU01068065.1.p3  ORF type:complete len:104 (+),score=12.98 GHVU01068065.1:172-483(+)
MLLLWQQCGCGCMTTQTTAWREERRETQGRTPLLPFAFLIERSLSTGPVALLEQSGRASERRHLLRLRCTGERGHTQLHTYTVSMTDRRVDRKGEGNERGIWA